MQQLSVFAGAFRYEFRMQIRRWAVWITLVLLALLIVGIVIRDDTVQAALAHLKSIPLLTVLTTWVAAINILLPVGVGVMLADRLPRDKRYKVDELFTSMQGALSMRLLGKYLGAMLATIVPMFLIYAIGVGYILYQTQNMLAIPLALETFAVITLPGILFIGVFSIACPAIMWVPLYQFLYVGYWFWGNIFPSGRGIPTLSDTILTPIGTFIGSGFFHAGLFNDMVHATTLQATESMVVLLGFVPLVFVALWGYLRWERARQ